MGQMIGQAIKEAREKAGLTQISVAEALGYRSGGQFISNIERGACSLPLAKVNRLAKILKISPDVIIEAKLVDTRERFRRKAKVGGSKARVSGTGL
jgi:transcriptional regulator with XRE-family HTH domain